MKILAPSILSADFSNLLEDVRIIEEAGAEALHIDVMDGRFVPNISFGSYVMKCLLEKTKLPFDVHLMIEEPDRYVEDFITDNTEIITVHQEACPHLNRTIQHIKSCGVKAGVSLNPSTAPGVLDYIIEDLDYILIMSVNPGFGGQKFIPSALRKISEISSMKKEAESDLIIAVDGGITLDNVGEAVKAGADLIVAGSSIFGAPDISNRVREFNKIIKGIV